MKRINYCCILLILIGVPALARGPTVIWWHQGLDDVRFKTLPIPIESAYSFFDNEGVGIDSVSFRVKFGKNDFIFLANFGSEARLGILSLVNSGKDAEISCITSKPTKQVSLTLPEVSGKTDITQYSTAGYNAVHCESLVVTVQPPQSPAKKIE